MNKPLSVLDAKIVKQKISGKNSKQIAADLMPDEPNGAVLVRKRLQKVTVRDALNVALIKEGITIEATLKPIKKALNATKKVYKDNKVIAEEDDLAMQLQGSDRARELLGIGKNAVDNSDVSDLTPSELEQLANESDEVKLTELVFKKNRG